MQKIDLRKQLRDLYTPPSKEPVLINVPKMNFAMIDGAGDPNSSAAFHEALEALYGISYTLKFMIKKGQEIDYPVMALEGLWWMKGGRSFDMAAKETWLWTLMVMQPDVVTGALFKAAVEQLRAKKDPPALSKVRLESFDEGLSVQIMHIGPYAAEPPTIEKLHAYASSNGYRLRGKHHEIYMGDPRRSAPEKLRTVLRQPVEKVG